MRPRLFRRTKHISACPCFPVVFHWVSLGVVAACTFTFFFFFFFSCRPRCPGIVSMCICGYHQVPFLLCVSFSAVLYLGLFYFLLLFLLWAHDIYLLKSTLRPFCCTQNSRSLSVLARRLALTSLQRGTYHFLLRFFFPISFLFGGSFFFFSCRSAFFLLSFPPFLSLPKMVSRILAVFDIQNSAFRSFFKLTEL